MEATKVDADRFFNMVIEHIEIKNVTKYYRCELKRLFIKYPFNIDKIQFLNNVISLIQNEIFNPYLLDIDRQDYNFESHYKKVTLMNKFRKELMLKSEKFYIFLSKEKDV